MKMRFMDDEGGEPWSRERLSIGKIAQIWWKGNMIFVALDFVLFVGLFKFVRVQLPLAVCKQFIPDLI